MAEVVGTVSKIEVPDEGSKRPYKFSVQTDSGAKTVSAFARIPDGQDNWVPNPALQAKDGDYGAFQGDFNEWTNNQGIKVKSFQATGFLPRTQTSPNGAEAPAQEAQGGGSRDASFALSYAKDLCGHLIDVTALKDENEIRATWGVLADFALEWLRQH